MNRSDVEKFFDDYRKALLARDAHAVASLYMVPCLIVSPGTPLAVTDAQQTVDFFASGWGQYDGIDELDATTTILAEAPGSLWVDVTWSYGGAPQERFCYQLVPGDGGHQIAVLTPMAAPSDG